MKRKLMNGNQAAALAVKLSRVQIVSAYPITPQTTIVEELADMWARGTFPGEYVSVESEYSAMAYLIGSAYSGARSFTATSCQGLAYMHELLHWASGARLPIVMVNVNRSMGAPWSLEPDQTDSLSQRDTGWIQIYCASVQEILDTVILSFRLAEESNIPCMVIYDGFSLSHTYEAVEPPEQEQVDAFLPQPPGRAAINPSNPKNIQAVTDSRYLSRVRQELQLTMGKVPQAIKQMENEFKQIFGRSNPLVESIGLHDAETVIVTAGSMGQTVKSVLPSLSSEHSKIGFLRFRLFRPLPDEDIAALMGNTKIKKVLVIDRNLSPGAGGIFAQELSALLQGTSFQGEIFQLNLSGGVDLTPDLLHKALEKVEGAEKSRDKIIWGVDL